MRVSNRFTPANGSENANQKSAVRHELCLRGVELAALVDQLGDGVASTSDRGSGRDQQQEDAAACRCRPSAAARSGPRARPGGKRREEHGRDRDAEHALRQHVDAERLVDRARVPVRDGVPKIELMTG